MLKKLILGLLIFVVLLCGYAAMKPSDYFITREITIHKPVEKIFQYLNSSKLMALWSPWAEIDPKAKMEITGPEAGIGSKTSWEGGEKLGTGSAAIVDSVENQRVSVKLEYVKPFQMIQDAEYLVKSVGSESVVTWSVKGKNNFMGRLMCIFVNVDKTVGGMFEKGLSNLKMLAESGN